MRGSTPALRGRGATVSGTMPIDQFGRLLDRIEAQQDRLSQLSTNHEMLTRQAYLQARDDINQRMADLINSRGGLSGLSARDRWRLTRDTGLIQNIEGRLTEMGVQHTSIVTNSFAASGALARGHLADELATLVHHVNVTSGIATPVAAIVDFAKLDSVAIELGLGTALNDVTGLTEAVKIQMRREITAGVAAGEGIRKLSSRIDGLEGISRNRAEVITRWSTIKSYNLAHQATYEAAEQSIPGLRKMWLAQSDERTCPHCLAQHGIVVDIVDDFDSNLTYASTPPEPYQGFTETPPLHGRCRCTITSWHESWRAYTSATPEELNAAARERAVAQGHPKASTAGTVGVLPEVGFEKGARSALGDMLSGIFILGENQGTVRIVEGVEMSAARLRLRNAGYRVKDVVDNPRLLRIDLPAGLRLPRMIRSTRLRAIPPGRWDEIKRGLTLCGLKK